MCDEREFARRSGKLIEDRIDAVYEYGEQGGVAYDFVPDNWYDWRIFMGENVFVVKEEVDE